MRGIALLGAPAIPLNQVIAKQARLAPAAIIAAIRNSRWYKSYLDHDPAKEIRKVRAPILILQGGRDQNVLASDTPRLVNAANATNTDVSVHYFRADNHEFLPGGELTPQYVDPAMIKVLLGWLQAHSK